MNSRIMGEHARNPVFGGGRTMEGLEYNHAELWSTRTIELPSGAEEAMIALASEEHARGHGRSDANGHGGNVNITA